jgi:tyrosyl-tRNA synthetase
VEIKADVELGGTEQLFSLLVARDLQQEQGQEGQVAMTMPILVGTDGQRKMSKSFGNYIGVSDSPDEMYGKTLSIPDSSLEDWYSLLLGRAPEPGLGPRDAKRALARALVERYHGPEAAQEAEHNFDQVHVRHELPGDIPVVEWSPDGQVHLPALLARAFGMSTSQARRHLGQGAVRIDGQAVDESQLDIPASQIDGRVIQVGRRRFARVKLAEGAG